MLGNCCGRRTVHVVEPLPEEIAQHYEYEIDEGVRITEGFGQLELVRTQAVIRPHLSGGPLSIIDIGGGTGVHAAWLAEDGHAVHVIDPVPRHVENARDLSNRHRQITAEVGDARQLPADDETFDAALVLGPLYHLTDREERLKALGEARRVVRPGGKLFVAAVSRFASLFYGLSRESLFDSNFRRIVERDLADGQHRNPERRPHWFTTAYFHHPDEFQHEAEAAELDVIGVIGVEGLAGWLSHLAARWTDPHSREAILYSAQAIEDEPTLLGLSAHLILVAQRPPND